MHIFSNAFSLGYMNWGIQSFNTKIKSFSVNHLELIDNDLALANGNDLRVYFRKDEDCRPREIDRVLENITTTKTRVLFRLQEDLSETVRDGSAYYLVYGNVIRRISSIL
jgi:chemotaxis methyl-accepting protein methylase